MNRVLQFLAIILLLSPSCKPDKPAPQPEDGPILSSPQENVTITEPNIAQKKPYTQILSDNRSHADALITTRIGKEGEAYSMLVVGYWNYRFVFNGESMSKEGDYDGKWLKYNDDFTYEYGTYDKIDGGGRYHFTLTDKIIILLDNDEKRMPEEWKILYKDEVMVMVGSNYFGSNGRQMKLERTQNAPVKS